MARPLAVPVLLVLLLARAATAGPGLFVRHAEDYYRPPLRRTLHPLESLPAAPPAEMRLPFREEDLFSLGEAGYMDDYQGESWDRAGPCSRYQAAFLLGGLLDELDRVYGLHLRGRPAGPGRRRLPPRTRWGRRRVRDVVAEGLLDPRPSQLTWWDEPPDRFQAAGWVDRLIEGLESRVTFLVDSTPLSRTLHGDMLYYGHPMRRRVRRPLRTRVMAAPGGRFRGRDPLGAREWVRIVERLRFVVHGYRHRESGVPEGAVSSSGSK